MRSAEMTADQVFALAISQFSAGDLGGAEDLLRQLLHHLPDHAGALNNLGVLLSRRGDIAGALGCYSKAIQAHPALPASHINMARCYLARDEINQARGAVMRALQLDPAAADAFGLCAAIHHRQGNSGAMERTLDRMHRLNPVSAETYAQRGHLCLAREQLDEAWLLATHAHRVVPDLPEPLFLLGECARKWRDVAAAVSWYRRYLEQAPADPLGASYQLATLGHGPMPSAMPAIRVQSLYDAYAPDFDRHLRDMLRYRGPEVLQTYLDRYLVGVNSGNGLDLGCGTGLAGPVLRRYMHAVDGVDLSQAMLAQAARREVYRQLFCRDIVEFLQAEQRYDVVIGLDSLIYTGNLMPAFLGIHSVLDGATDIIGTGQGLFIASFEALPDDADTSNYDLQINGRYRHCPRYIHQTAQQTGFTCLALEAVHLRLEKGEAVPSVIVVMTRP